MERFLRFNTIEGEETVFPTDKGYTASPESLLLVFPFRPISINAYWGNGLKRRRYVTKAGKKFKKKITDCIQNIFTEPMKVPKITGPVEITLCFGLKKDMDLDNLPKVFLDAIKNVLIEDDAEIYWLKVIKLRGVSSDAISLRIDKIEEDVFEDFYWRGQKPKKKKQKLH